MDKIGEKKQVVQEEEIEMYTVCQNSPFRK